MSDDIEHLKIHKIAPRSTSDRVFLPQLGRKPAPSQPPDGAYGKIDASHRASGNPSTTKNEIIEAIKTVYDPEIPVNVFDLGLIYNIEVSETGHAEVEMTLTAPACPVAGAIVQEIADKIAAVQGVTTSHVNLVWDPPWTQDRMTEEAKLELGLL
ncbi:MAG: DUF59 domain-containing protein [Polyangiales bacterium]